MSSGTGMGHNTNSARVEAILAGATEAFSAKGFAATSMREVARAAGASLGSIYYHFPSKEDILREIICDNFRRVQERLQRRLAQINSPRQRLEAFVENHLEFFAEHLDQMRVMSHELDTLSGEAGDEVTALRRAYTRAATGILSDLRPDLSANEILVAALCLFGMLNWTYRWFHTVRSQITSADLAGRMSSTFLDGFIAPRPA